jgi:hypothetical protein
MRCVKRSRLRGWTGKNNRHIEKGRGVDVLL